MIRRVFGELQFAGDDDQPLTSWTASVLLMFFLLIADQDQEVEMRLIRRWRWAGMFSIRCYYCIQELNCINFAIYCFTDTALICTRFGLEVVSVLLC